jgi:hypothetical protein
MERILRPEILDSLPPDHPDAVHSRRDLLLINRILGNERWFRGQLRNRIGLGERVLELGAGNGDLGLALAGRGYSVDGLDLCPRPSNWAHGARWHQADIRSFSGFGDYPILIASLTLHHFSQTDLGSIGARVSGARLILASEPARRALSQVLIATLGPVLSANRVTLHDARVSVAAGFVGEELPHALGLSASQWAWSCGTSTLGAYRMVAWRR